MRYLVNVKLMEDKIYKILNSIIKIRHLSKIVLSYIDIDNFELEINLFNTDDLNRYILPTYLNYDQYTDYFNHNIDEFTCKIELDNCLKLYLCYYNVQYVYNFQKYKYISPTGYSKITLHMKNLYEPLGSDSYSENEFNHKWFYEEENSIYKLLLLLKYENKITINGNQDLVHFYDSNDIEQEKFHYIIEMK